MYQKRRKQQRGIVVFCLIVIMGGVLLGATENLQNPFDAIGNIGTFLSMGKANEEKGPPVTLPQGSQGGDIRGPATPGQIPKGEDVGKGQAGTSNTIGHPQTDDAKAANGEFPTTIQWDRIGQVIFNLWALAATTVVIILIEQLVGRVAKPTRSQGRPRPA